MKEKPRLYLVPRHRGGREQTPAERMNESETARACASERVFANAHVHKVNTKRQGDEEAATKKTAMRKKRGCD